MRKELTWEEERDEAILRIAETYGDLSLHQIIAVAWTFGYKTARIEDICLVSNDDILLFRNDIRKKLYATLSDIHVATNWQAPSEVEDDEEDDKGDDE